MTLTAATPYCAHWCVAQIVRVVLWALRGVHAVAEWVRLVLEQLGIIEREQEWMDAAAA